MMRVLEKPVLVRESLLSYIGRTPLLRLGRIVNGKRSGVQIFAKAEWFNPGGSVKDRAALNMIREGERTGQLTEGKTILDATSGNTGIAYAMIGAALGYRVHLAVPANASIERKRMLAAYGAEVTYTNPLEGTDGSQRFVKELHGEYTGKYFYPDQYNNPANWQAHYKSTAPEIFEQTKGAITHFVAGLGTTGTFVGVARRLKELNPEITCVSVQPDSPMHGLEGLKHLETALVPGIYDEKLADKNVEIGTEEAQEMTKRLAREEGLFVGTSSGAAMAVALKMAETLDDGTIVVIFPDGGEKYLNDSMWEN